jgi:hypothetical protein
MPKTNLDCITLHIYFAEHNVMSPIKIKGKGKGFPNRSGVAHRVPGGLGSQIFMTFWHMKVVRSLASRTGRLYPQEMFLVLIFTRD